MYYKWLNEDGTTPQQGAQWKLPRGKRPGAWMPPVRGELIACKNGYHIVSEVQLIEWIAPALWECEPRGEAIDWGDKSGCRSARLVRRVETWNEKTARLFACDCAERALTIAGDEADPRSMEAVRISRLFAAGAATKEQLSAARAAAWDAARAAAWAAAWDAARAAAWDAARAAAWAAAWDAAWAAACDAARAAERQWQNERLMAYIRGDIGA